MAWTDDTTLNNEFNEGQIAKSSSMQQLNANVVAVGDRQANAPRSLPLMEVFDTAGSFTWNVPAGVKRVRIRVVGGGAGDGDNTINGRSLVTGDFGTVQADGANQYDGGAAVGGNLNIAGEAGSQVSDNVFDTLRGGSTPLGFGSSITTLGVLRKAATGFGGGGYLVGDTIVSAFAAGGYAEVVVTTTQSEQFTIEVGASGGDNSTGGVVIIEH